MEKIYYNKISKQLCNRYPYDIPVDENCDFVEVPDEEADNTYICEIGKSWAVVDGQLTIIDVEEVQNTLEYKKLKNEARIMDLQEFLNNTDYVVIKLYEALITNDSSYEDLKTKYADIIEQRKAARAEINSLEE